MIYLNETFLQIRTEQSVAIMEWKGLAKGEAYRKGFEQYLKLLLEGKYTHWLLDFTNGKVIDVKDQKWTTDEWLPHAVATLKGNIQKVGIILSTDVFNKVASRVIATTISKLSEAEIAYFDDKRDAMAWLTQPEAVAV
ncbi:MAG: STAS/SEC14 domain-containing protein [Cytophagales bacterium]|nr:STAS/SEC14 domain-containing protein [Cytophagales bacterium]